MRYLHGDGEVRPAEKRTAFEHHLPHTNVLVAFPLEAWPHLDAAMAARTRRTSAWSGRLTSREKELAPRLLAHITAHGPAGSADFDDPRKGRRVWGHTTLVKSTLQKLFFHGRLLIATRVNNHRRYDLPERVLPAAILARKPSSVAETARWITILKLRQFRLAILKREEATAASDLIQPVEIEGCPRLYCLRSDAPKLEECEQMLRRSSRGHEAGMVQTAGDSLVTPAATHVSPLRLLAPLDPIIYQRRLTSALWGFDYTWEVYTPPLKRMRGYYALPVLAGTEIVGHVDPKADRAARKLVVVSRRIRRGYAVAPATRAFAQWLGLKQGGACPA